jgi:OOP family OmpA-OmpF porin
MIRLFLFIFTFCLPCSLAVGQKVKTEDLDALVRNLNTRYDEQNPVLSPNGLSMYFTRAHDSLNIGGTKDKGDIWLSTLTENGTWGPPANLGAPINDELKNYLLGFSPDGTIMFLNQERKAPGGLIANDGISYSVYRNGKWSKPSKAPVDYLFNKSGHQSGSVSADGKKMLLSLHSYASRGEEDLYISTYENGKWTQPVNLGSDINTARQEMTPYLSPDGKKLYFSSNGHGGKGGRDLFVAERNGKSWRDWSKPINLGPDVNSIGVELNYFIDSKNSIAYFSTTQNSDGYGDIRAHQSIVERPDVDPAEDFHELSEITTPQVEQFKVYGTISDVGTSQGIAVAINLKSANAEYNTITDNMGRYTFLIPMYEGSFTIGIKAPGYLGKTETIIVVGDEVEANFSLMPLEVGATMRLNKVYFDRGTANLLDQSFEELQNVVAMMRENPSVKIQLSGHTDNQGNSKLNLKLSEDRVDAVAEYLTEQGIDKKRIKGKGFGGTKPVASNASEETRKLNRRVEITIVKN